jgi:hypothetical protein
MTKIAGSRFINQRHGSEDPDPDPHQNVMDPQHWLQGGTYLTRVPYITLNCAVHGRSDTPTFITATVASVGVSATVGVSSQGL